MYKAVIFDLDGTLLDTLEDIGISCNYVLSQYKKSPRPIEDYKFLVGQGASRLLKNILPELSELEHKRARALFEEHYNEQYDKHTKPYENINKVLTFLQARGYKMAILSNKPNIFTKKCVYKYLSAWTFEAAYGIREGIPRKPNRAGVDAILEELHVKENECLYVGDTDTDMLTAKAANLTSIGVLWGFREKEELLSSGAKYIVKEPNELIKLVATIESVVKENG